MDDDIWNMFDEIKEELTIEEKIEEEKIKCNCGSNKITIED